MELAPLWSLFIFQRINQEEDSIDKRKTWDRPQTEVPEASRQHYSWYNSGNMKPTLILFFIALLVLFEHISSEQNHFTLATSSKFNSIHRPPLDTSYTESESPFHKTKTILRRNNATQSFSQYSYPSLKELKDYLSKIKRQKGVGRDVRNFIPRFHGSIIPTKKISNSTFEGHFFWDAECFKKNNGTIQLDYNLKQAKLHFISSDASSYLCMDWYFVATRDSYHIKQAFLHGSHELLITKLDDSELNDIQHRGLRIFTFPDGILGTLIDVYHALKLLYGTYFMKDKIKFLEEYMDIEFVERPVKKTYLDPKYISNGDIFIKNTLSGADGLIMYGTGGRSGHMTVAFWHPDGQLYIAESTDTGVIETPYDQWYEMQDPETQFVDFAKLKPELSKRFNITKAIEFFKSVEGSPYGYTNLAYGWIDTISDNYPTPLDEHVLPAAMVFFEALFPDVVRLSFIEGINQRFNQYFKDQLPERVECENVNCVFKYLDVINKTLSEVMALVERDEWTYAQGKQMVCSGFITQVYKHAGIFDESVASTIEGNEFTPKDVYQLDIYDMEWDRPEPCLVNGDKYPFCQLVGRWYWDLPGFGTIKPYEHMNEKCGAMPPDYKRIPEKC